MPTRKAPCLLCDTLVQQSKRETFTGLCKPCRFGKYRCPDCGQLRATDPEASHECTPTPPRFCTRCQGPLSPAAKGELCKPCYRDTHRCPDCGRVLPAYAGNVHQCSATGPHHCRKCAVLLSEYRTGAGLICRTCRIAETTAYLKTSRVRAQAIYQGKCSRCGYCRCAAALDFHHRFPDSKEKYAGKRCVSPRHVIKHPEMYELLCANCHREEHHPD